MESRRTIQRMKASQEWPAEARTHGPARARGIYDLQKKSAMNDNWGRLQIDSEKRQEKGANREEEKG